MMHPLETTATRFQSHHPAGRPILIAALFSAISLLLFSPLLPAIPARPEISDPDSALNSSYEPIPPPAPGAETASTTTASSDTTAGSHSAASSSSSQASDSSRNNDLASTLDSTPTATAGPPAPPAETKRRIITRPTLHGLFSTWGAFSCTSTNLGQFGARFLPEFSLEFDLRSRRSSRASAAPEPAYPNDGNVQLPSSPNVRVPTSSIPSNGISSSITTSHPNILSSFAVTSSLPISPLTGPSVARPLYGGDSTDDCLSIVHQRIAATPETVVTAIGLYRPSSPTALTDVFTPRHAQPTATTPAAQIAPSPSPHSSSLTFELSFNIWGTLTVQQGAENQFRGQLKPYRLSLKYATSRFEARLGLQKISFGSAALLRPLMWFDRIDPRDPIQLTDGVYGLLLRAYIATRTNFWAWALYGNDQPKGLEILPTKQRSPELGGRLQFPAGPGELALTVHHRRTDFNLAMAGNNPSLSLIPTKPASPLAFTFPETRLAADGKWDIGPGLWFEATLTNQHSAFLAFPWQRALAIGLDYTFAAGNGFHLLTEYFQSDMATAALSGTTYAPFRARFLAASASYPLTLLDQLSAIVFYDTLNRNLYSFIRWQRTYDRWSFHLMAFWNPAEFRIFASPGANQPNLFAGKGLQLLLLYNF